MEVEYYLNINNYNVYNYIQFKIFIMVKAWNAIKCRCRVYCDLILEDKPHKANLYTIAIMQYFMDLKK